MQKNSCIENWIEMWDSIQIFIYVLRIFYSFYSFVSHNLWVLIWRGQDICSKIQAEEFIIAFCFYFGGVGVYRFNKALPKIFCIGY